jgi:FkbM family methyltransferase
LYYKLKSFFYFNLIEITHLLKKLYFSRNHYSNLIYDRFILEFLLKENTSVLKNGKELQIKNYLGLNITLRKNTSDFQVFHQIMVDQEYLAVNNLLKKYQINLKTMVDCGANIGLSSLYFKSIYPDALVISLEPDQENVKQIEKNINLNKFRGIHCLNKGVWSSNSPLLLKKDFRDGNYWSFYVEEAPMGIKPDVEGIDLKTIIRNYQLKTIDLLKIDIEGGERYLFDDKYDLTYVLQITNCIAIEIHDEFQIRDYIYSILKENDFIISESKELTIGIKKQFITS